VKRFIAGLAAGAASWLYVQWCWVPDWRALIMAGCVAIVVWTTGPKGDRHER
jgi:hypothetical protein